jgi:hypothetical protein
MLLILHYCKAANTFLKDHLQHRGSTLVALLQTLFIYILTTSLLPATQWYKMEGAIRYSAMPVTACHTTMRVITQINTFIPTGNSLNVPCGPDILKINSSATVLLYITNSWNCVLLCTVYLIYRIITISSGYNKYCRNKC